MKAQHPFLSLIKLFLAKPGKAFSSPQPALTSPFPTARPELCSQSERSPHGRQTRLPYAFSGLPWHWKKAAFACSGAGWDCLALSPCTGPGEVTSSHARVAQWELSERFCVTGLCWGIASLRFCCLVLLKRQKLTENPRESSQADVKEPH